MYVRIIGRAVEVWRYEQQRSRRVFHWQIAGRRIPESVRAQLPPYVFNELQDRVDRLIQGPYPVPDGIEDPANITREMLKLVTAVCGHLRSGTNAIQAEGIYADAIVACMRLEESLRCCGVILPERRRPRKLPRR